MIKYLKPFYVLFLAIVIVYIFYLAYLSEYYEYSYVSETKDYGFASKPDCIERFGLGSIREIAYSDKFDFLYIDSAIHSALWDVNKNSCKLIEEFKYYDKNIFSTISKSGKYIVAPYSKDESQIKNYETKSELILPKILNAVFSKDENFVAFVQINKLRVLNLKNNEFILDKIFEVDSLHTKKMLISLDNKYLYYKNERDSITKYDIQTGNILHVFNFENNIYEWFLNDNGLNAIFCFNSFSYNSGKYDGSKIFSKFKISTLDAISDKEISSVFYDKVIIQDDKFDYNEILCLYDTKYTYIYDTKTHELICDKIEKPKSIRYILHAIINKEMNNMLIMDCDENIYLQSFNNTEDAFVKLDISSEPKNALMHKNKIFVIDIADNLWFLDDIKKLNKLTLVNDLYKSTLKYAKLFNNNKNLLSISKTYNYVWERKFFQICIWDYDKYNIIKSYSTGFYISCSYECADISPDGKYLAILEIKPERCVRIIDWNSDKIVKKIYGIEYPSRKVSFNDMDLNINIPYDSKHINHIEWLASNTIMLKYCDYRKTKLYQMNKNQKK